MATKGSSSSGEEMPLVAGNPSVKPQMGSAEGTTSESKPKETADLKSGDTGTSKAEPSAKVGDASTTVGQDENTATGAEQPHCQRVQAKSR